MLSQGSRQILIHIQGRNKWGTGKIGDRIRVSAWLSDQTRFEFQKRWDIALWCKVRDKHDFYKARKSIKSQEFALCTSLYKTFVTERPSNSIQVLTPSRLLLNSFVKPALSSRENRCQKQSLPEPVRTNGQFVRVERLEEGERLWCPFNRWFSRRGIVLPACLDSRVSDLHPGKTSAEWEMYPSNTISLMQISRINHLRRKSRFRSRNDWHRFGFRHIIVARQRWQLHQVRRERVCRHLQEQGPLLQYGIT